MQFEIIGQIEQQETFAAGQGIRNISVKEKQMLSRLVKELVSFWS